MNQRVKGIRIGAEKGKNMGDREEDEEQEKQEE